MVTTSSWRALAAGALAVASSLTALPSHAAVGLCDAAAFSAGRCALYVDASGSAGATASLGPELRGGEAFPVDLTGAYSFLGSSSRFELSGVATFGMLSNRVAVTAGTTGVETAPNVSAVANLNLYFSDRLTFLSPTLPVGTLGTAYARVAVVGGVGASPATYPATESQATAQVVTNGGSAAVAAYGDRPGTGSIPGIITFELPVSFNRTDFTALNVQLGTGARAIALNGVGAVYAASAGASFVSGVQWLGIDRVVDAGGSVVGGWTVQSASGFDYAQSYVSQAVPEPAGAAMLMLGLATVLSLRAARRAERAV